MRTWALGSPEGDWVSMAVPSDGSYGIAPGVIWVTALLAVLLSLERLFLADFEDGSLEQVALCERFMARLLERVAA